MFQIQLRKDPSAACWLDVLWWQSVLHSTNSNGKLKSRNATFYVLFDHEKNQGNSSRRRCLPSNHWDVDRLPWNDCQGHCLISGLGLGGSPVPFSHLQEPRLGCQCSDTGNGLEASNQKKGSKSSVSPRILFLPPLLSSSDWVGQWSSAHWWPLSAWLIPCAFLNQKMPSAGKTEVST